MLIRRESVSTCIWPDRLPACTGITENRQSDNRTFMTEYTANNGARPAETAGTAARDNSAEHQPSDFTQDELHRYSRHILLQEVGIEGQEKIRQGRVLVVGAGGLGSPVALYLTAAGVGTIGIVDGDVVDVSNLQRQVIHFTPDVGRPKVESAAEKMRLLNPGVKVETYGEFLTAANAPDIIGGYDFIVDCTDNLAAKFLINDACVAAGKPFSHGGILRFEGHTFTHLPGTACYRCLFPTPPPADEMATCSRTGVLGAIAGMLGTIQAAEVLKFLTGAGRLLTDRLLRFDARTMEFREVRFARQKGCPLCGRHAE